MKTIFTFLFFIISATFFSQNISGKVTYQITTKPFAEKRIDSITKKINIKNKKLRNMVKSMFKDMPDITSFLDFNKNESLYYLEDKMDNSSRRTININRIIAGGDNKTYNNVRTKEHFRTSDTFGEPLLIEILPQQWQITQESKKIGKYLCFKATTQIEQENRKGKYIKTVIAWFTPQIPVSFGPKSYAGLPGLILEVKDKRITITVKKIVLNPKKEVVIVKPAKGKKITEDEMNKLAKEMSYNRYKRN